MPTFDRIVTLGPVLGKGHIRLDSAARILRKVCLNPFLLPNRFNLNEECWIPLRVIQKISGHLSLTVLQGYLEVTPKQVREAASSLSLYLPDSVITTASLLSNDCC